MGDPFWQRSLDWLWDNKEWVLRKIWSLRTWLASSGEDGSQVLIIGPGGVGKSTTAMLLAGKFDDLYEIPGEYNESIGVESFQLKDDPTVELVVPPGQKYRRDATWTQVQSDLAAGKYRGVIVVGAFGYHSIGQISYTKHRLYNGDKEDFVAKFLDACRKDEVDVVKRLAPFLPSTRNRFWILSLVTKQDLWWTSHKQVEQHYRDGDYGKAIHGVTARLGSAVFRHECVFCSLVLQNLRTGAGEVLSETVAGYDQTQQVASRRQLWEAFDALREWETTK